MENVVEWLECLFWIAIIVMGVTFMFYQLGIIDGMAELVAKMIFGDYIISL